jgi:hypothetical protein
MTLTRSQVEEHPKDVLIVAGRVTERPAGLEDESFIPGQDGGLGIGIELERRIRPVEPAEDEKSLFRGYLVGKSDRLRE